MFTIIGLVVVVASVLGGFTLAGGQIPSLFHLSEILVICGTALGTVLVSTPAPVLASMLPRLLALLQPSPFDRTLYLDSLKLLYELFQLARRDGLVAIESHIEAPAKSTLFKRYPKVAHHHHAIVFLCDSLRLVLVGSVPPYDLEALMDAEIELHHHHANKPGHALQKVSDALPGIGIVAAVLGIVVTMSAIAGPIEKIGEHVAAALTGTFLGVLLAYGFVGPLSTGLEHATESETHYMQFLRASVVAFAKGFAPLVAVEFARRAVDADVRPSFAEMETACKSLKGKPEAKAA